MDRNQEQQNKKPVNPAPAKENKNVSAEEGSKTDPQLTELDGLKKGGVDPHVHPEDLPGKKEDNNR